MALARYAETLDDARYAEEFGGARLAGKVQAIEEVKAQVLQRMRDAGATFTPGEFNPGHRFQHIPNRERVPKITTDDRIKDLTQVADFVGDDDYVARMIIRESGPTRLAPKLDSSTFTDELTSLHKGYEDIEVRPGSGYEDPDGLNAGPSRPGSGYEDPDGLNAGPSRPGSGYEDPDGLNAGPSRPGSGSDDIEARPEPIYDDIVVRPESGSDDIEVRPEPIYDDIVVRPESGYEDPNALNAVPPRPGDGYEDPTGLFAQMPPESAHYTIGPEIPSHYDRSLVSVLSDTPSGGAYDVIRGTEALEADYDAIGRSADDARIYDVPPDADFATFETPLPQSPRAEKALADAREVVAWADNRNLFERAWGRFKETLYDIRDMPLVILEWKFLGEGKLDEMMELARVGRGTKDAHRTSSGVVMTLADAQDILRRSDGVFDTVTPAGGTPFAQSQAAFDAHYNKLKLTKGGDNWEQIFGRATRHHASFSDADFDDLAGPEVGRPRTSAPEEIESPEIPRVYKGNNKPVPKNFKDFVFEDVMGARPDALLTDSAQQRNQYDTRIIDNHVAPAVAEIREHGINLLQRFDPDFDLAMLNGVGEVDMRNRLLELADQAEQAGDMERAANMRAATEEWERMAHRKMYDAVEAAERFNEYRVTEVPARINTEAALAELDRRIAYYDAKMTEAMDAGDFDAVTRHQSAIEALNTAKFNLEEGADPLLTLRAGHRHAAGNPNFLDAQDLGWQDATREVEALWNARLQGKKPVTDKQLLKVHRQHEKAKLIEQNLRELNLV